MIKKIMSVIASIAMIGSTAFFASAASTSSIFGSNTQLNNLGSLDAPAMNIMNDHIASLNISEANQTIINGEMAAVKTASQPLYLGDTMSITKSVFTETQLPNVLASGEVNGDGGTNYEYNLKIDIPNSITKYGEPENNLDKAIIYSDFSNDESYNLRIIFPTAVDVKELAGETISLFGKEYSFSEDEGDLDNESITLFEKSNSVKINSGETITVEGHAIKADIEDEDSATLYVDGVSKSVNDNDWSGKINGLDIYVKNIFASNIEGGSRYIQISLNTKKLILSNNNEVERGSNSIDGTNVIISPSGNKIREIIINVIPSNVDINNENIDYIGLGESFIDPVFNTIKFSLDSVTPGLKSDRDYIKLKTSGEKGAVLEFTNKAGKDYTFSFIDDGNLNFLTSNIPEEGYFITGSNEYTQIWKVEDIKDDSIKLKDQGSNSDTIILSLSSGNVELSLADGSSATIHSTGILLDTVEKSVNFVYTENGAKITLNDKIDDNITTTVNESVPMSVKITEETPYNGGDFKSNNGSELGKTIDVEIKNPTTDLGLLIGDYKYSYSDDDNKYALTIYGSFIDSYKDERIELYYPESAMQINFNIGEITSEITNVPTEGSVSEIVFGGTCVSSEAQRLLGVGQLCGPDFTALTNVGENQALIQVFQDTNDKIAILVAGYETADTLRASNYLKDNYKTMNLSPGSKLIV